MLGSALIGSHRHTRQIDAVEHVGVDEFGRQVEGHDVEVGCRAVGVDREEGEAVLAQQRLQVDPGSIGALGHRIVTLVEDLIEDLQPLVGQPDLVGVGVGEEPRHLVRGVARRLGTVFAADVAGRFLHLAQKGLELGPETGHRPPMVPEAPGRPGEPLGRGPPSSL